MLKKIHTLLGIALALLLCPVSAEAVFTETFGTSTGKDATMNEFYRAEGNVGIISRGAGLSNPRNGNIVISSIPAGATIKRAWLYWGGYLSGIDEAKLSSVNFNGTAIDLNSTPAAVEFGRESNRRAYRADVLSLINAGGNGTYPVSVTSHTKKSTFGASLIIVYEDLDSLDGTAVIVDGMVMISLSHAGNIANGTSFASTINNLTLSDPPNGQATIIVSEGTAVDANEFTFNGSSSHNYGDFASNNDGLVWDNRTVDVGSYLSAGTTSISSTLADVDTPGWYSHYFAFIFYTNRLQASFEESTMTLGNGNQVRAGETVEATAVLENTGAETGDATLTVTFGGDTNTAYVPESTEIDGVAKTDADDADEVVYDSNTDTLTITVEDIAVDDDSTVTLDVTADNNLSTGDNINIQGTITTAGATVQTDSDGSETDGIDEPAQNTIVNGYRIKNLRNTIRARTKNGSTIESTDPTGEYLTSAKTVYLETKNDNEPLAEFNFPFENDGDATNFDANANESSTVVHNLRSIDSEDIPSFTMYVSIPEAYRTLSLSELKLRMCVGAQTLSEVEVGCAERHAHITEEYVFLDGETHGGMTCNLEYENSVPVRWKCTGVTGTGGQSEGPPADVPEFEWWALALLATGMAYMLQTQRFRQLWQQ